MVQGKKINALIDTGASTSLLRQDVWQSLTGNKILKKCDKIYAVNGTELDVSGTTEIKFDKACPISVIIMRSMRHQCIIGADALRNGHAILDYYKATMRWYGHYYKLGVHESIYAVESIKESSGYNNIDKLLNEYEYLFDTAHRPNAGKVPNVKCTIPTGNHPPIRQRAYRLPLRKHHIVREQIKEMLDMGVIQPSSSPWASPITLVPKKDGSTRFCIDFRKVNSITRKDAYPLPLISDIFDSLTGAKVFTTLDLKSGYWQIPMKEEDKEKTAFICSEGLYEWNRMPFGLTNAGATFQRCMTDIFRDYVGQFIFVYIDDIVIYSQDIQQHENHLRLIFQRLSEYNLQLKRKKCVFAAQSVDLLGYHVSAHGIAPQEQKCQAIKNMSPPNSVNGVRSLLGTTGYYRNCIPNYADVVEPLVSLTRRHARFHWGPSQQNAFEKLKQLLCSDQVLAYPNTQKPYKLYTDASNYAIGGILVQDDENGVERVVQYISSSLKGSQLNWPTIEKEAYALIYALQKLRPYLYGAQFTVYTDHKPLKSLFLGEVKNTKIQRWAVLIAEYGCNIEYIAGKKNIRADMLSRLRTPSETATFDTGDYVIPEVEDGALPYIPLEHDNINCDDLRRYQQEEFGKMMKDVPDDCMMHNGILYSTRCPSSLDAAYPRIILPTPLRKKVLQNAHERSGHQGMRKTLCLVRDAYVWEGMRKDVTQMIDTCPKCQVNRRITVRTPYSEMPLARYPNQVIGMDLIGPLIKSTAGNQYILTIVDHCTAWAEAYPIPYKRAECVSSKFFNEYCPRHGIPEIVVTDLGSEFNANSLRNQFKAVGIDHRRSTPYHPQTNGRTERFNRTLKGLLQKSVNNQTHHWEDELSGALTAYRSNRHETTGYTPFFLTYGRRARLPLSLPIDAGQGLDDRLTNLANALHRAKQGTQKSREYHRKQINSRANMGEYKVGDTVVRKADERIKLTSFNDPQWEIYKINGPVAHIKHQQSGKTAVVNVCKLRVIDPELTWDKVHPRPIRNTGLGTRQSVLRANQLLNANLPQNNFNGADDLTFELENDNDNESVTPDSELTEPKTVPNDAVNHQDFDEDASSDSTILMGHGSDIEPDMPIEDNFTLVGRYQLRKRKRPAPLPLPTYSRYKRRRRQEAALFFNHYYRRY